MGKLAQRLHLGVRGDLRVVLARDSFQPGDEISGTVCLRIDKPIAPAQLHLCVRGEQRLRWNERRGETAAPHSASFKHLDITAILADANSTFEAGELQYPFSFTLPTEGLLPNFAYARGRVGSLERVRYELEYAVDTKLFVDSHTTANLSASTPFVLERAMPDSAVETNRSVAVQQTHAVKLLGLFQRGSCRMEMRLSTDGFRADSTIEAHVVLEVDTSRTLKYATLVLYEDATVNRQRGKALKHSSRVVGSRRFEGASLGLSGNRLERALHLPITPNDLYKFDTLLPTLDTHFLGLHYRVAFECHFAAATTTRISVPVRIAASRATLDHPSSGRLIDGDGA